MGEASKPTWIESVRKIRGRVQDRLRYREASSSACHSRPVHDEYDMFAFLTEDMNAGTQKPPKARFEELFVGDGEWMEDRVRETLARVGIDTMFIEADCDPRRSLRALTRRDVEWMAQDMRSKTQGWKLACAWEDDHGDVALRYVRPMIPGVAAKEIGHD
ncbi:hypothetical protein [Asaia spathodeae]|uniref:Uncharacterized protein n=1 Tax=Asaia spathodeae TaxID=657016 RepID=A0ABX2P7Q4_9PROT|nr:hypothetical protein [Asaia spathodeae]GBR20956.1 hypothetical protein AA105894_2678 [Asaia spathodeae NBRC 105894]